mgnify:CR=1 FL=1
MRAAFASVGRSDANVEAVQGAEGLFAVTIYGLDAKTTDEKGNCLLYTSDAADE